MAQESSADKKPNVVILKLDDLRNANPNGGFRRVLEFLKSRNIKSTAGIICNSLEGDKAAYHAWIKELQASGMVGTSGATVTLTGSRRTLRGDVMEFKGVPYETQKETLVKCQKAGQEKAGIPRFRPLAPRLMRSRTPP